MSRSAQLSWSDYQTESSECDLLKSSALDTHSPECYSDSGNFLVFSGYHPSVSLVSTSQPEIINNIQQLNIEPEVINKAIEIYYRSLTERASAQASTSSHLPNRVKSVKGSRKIQLIFYCVFTAYLELGSAVDPCYSADLVGLPRNEIDQALSEYSPSGVTSIEPEKLVPFYVRRLNQMIESTGLSLNESAVTEEVQQVIEVCRSTEVGKEGIANTSSRIVAIVALYFYLNDISGSKVVQNTSLFETACYLSWACIRRYHEQIAHYYNYRSNKFELPDMSWLN